MPRKVERDYGQFLEHLASLLKRDTIAAADIARFCGVSPKREDVAREILDGTRRPNDAFIQSVADTLHTSDQERKNLRQQLTAIRKSAPLSRTKSILDDYKKKGLRTLRLAGLKYAPFSGSSDEFFEKVFSRFFTLAGFEVKQQSTEHGYTSRLHKKSDVIMGLFDSPDRMISLDVKFWRVPIRLGLGAICLRRHQNAAPKIARVLSNLEDKSSCLVRPIVVRDEVGHIHCKYRLKYTDEEIDQIPNLDIKGLAQRLLHWESQRTKDGDPFPVVCIDELSALGLLSELSNHRENEEGLSIFPLNSRRANQDQRNVTRRELPQYYCSLATKNHNDAEFNAFMNDALIQFLSTEVETIAREWMKLALALVSKLMSQHLPCDAPYSTERMSPEGNSPAEARRLAYTWEWVFYTLSLDDQSIDSFATFGYMPWRPILRRARQLALRHVFDNPEMIAGLVEYLRVSRSGQARLSQLLDINIDDIAAKKTTKAVVEQIRQQLIATQPERHFIVKAHDLTKPGMDKQMSAIEYYMESVKDMYEDKDYPQLRELIKQEIKNLDRPSSE